MDVLKAVISFSSGIYLWGVILSLYYRFPIPLAGYIGPFGQFSSNLFNSLSSVAAALLFYAIFGGFIVVLIVGQVSGSYIQRSFVQTNTKNKYHIASGFILGFFPCFYFGNIGLYHRTLVINFY